MPAYDELNVLVNEVNEEVAELDAATEAESQALAILDAAKIVVDQEETQVETKLDALLVAVQTRIALLKGEPTPEEDPVP